MLYHGMITSKGRVATKIIQDQQQKQMPYTIPTRVFQLMKYTDLKFEEVGKLKKSRWKKDGDKGRCYFSNS